MRSRGAAIAAVFAANGLGAPSFLARLPERQGDLGLSDAALGAGVAGLAAGALVASPLAGRWVGTRASGRVLVTASALVLGGCLWLAGAAPTGGWLVAALALVGAADSTMDISMNATGAGHEELVGRSFMHRFHAAWSLGALGAACGAGLAAGLGVPLTWHLAIAGAVLVAATLAGRRALGDAPAPATPRRPPPTHPARPGGPSGDLPGRRRVTLARPLLALAAAAAGGAVVEGAPTDWAAIQLDRYGAAGDAAALGMAAFMAGMVAVRLGGDRLTDRWGSVTMLRSGMALVAVGIGLGTLAGHPASFTAGLALAGAGAAGFFPLAFSSAARLPGVSPGAGAATVSLAARLGFMAEPLAIGAVAEVAGLRWSFGLVGATAAALAMAGRRIASPRPRDA